MSDVKRNEELFFAVADAIEAHPDQYDQRSYFAVAECGTTACIAGWARALTRHKSLDLARRANDRDPDYGLRTARLACTALGLTVDDADQLFHQRWRPHHGLSVGDALRKIGGGASIGDVSE